MCSDWGMNRSLGMCPDHESSWKPLGYGTMLQPTEPHWPGQTHTFYMSPFPSSSLQSGGTTNCSPCSWLLFRPVFDHKSKPQSSKWAQRSVIFPLFHLLSICMFIAHFCYDSALVKGNGYKVYMSGTQGMCPWIKLHLGNGVGMGEIVPNRVAIHQQYAMCW